MLAKLEDTILQEKVVLYNNIATSDDCTGRLRAELQIQPSPRISWEFESLGEVACRPDMTDHRLDKPLEGMGFAIDKPYVTGESFGSVKGSMARVVLRGVAPRAHFEDPATRCHSFRFCLPNAQFVRRGFAKTEVVKKKYVTAEKEEVPGGIGYRRIEARLDETWRVRLTTPQNALEWLEPRRENTGTFVTTLGSLYHPKDHEDEAEPSSEAPTMNLEEALEKLSVLSLMLSYANGGYLGPLYIEGYQKGEESKFASIVVPHSTTPLERLGTSWVAHDSDFEAYLRCSPAFRRMENTTHWQEAFAPILTWYFQAIQSRHWAVVAVAAGAALERLAYTILKKDLGESYPGTAKARLKG